MSETGDVFEDVFNELDHCNAHELSTIDRMFCVSDNIVPSQRYNIVPAQQLSSNTSFNDQTFYEIFGLPSNQAPNTNDQDKSISAIIDTGISVYSNNHVPTNFTSINLQ